MMPLLGGPPGAFQRDFTHCARQIHLRGVSWLQNDDDQPISVVGAWNKRTGQRIYEGMRLQIVAAALLLSLAASLVGGLSHRERTCLDVEFAFTVVCAANLTIRREGTWMPSSRSGQGQHERVGIRLKALL